MQRELSIERLKECLKKLQALSPDQFDFSDFVSEWDTATARPVVCDIAGWHPEWFPEAKIIWFRNWSIGHKDNPSEGGRIDTALADFYGIDQKTVDALFYAGYQKELGIGLTPLYESSSLNEVAGVWQQVILTIEEDPENKLQLLQIS